MASLAANNEFRSRATRAVLLAGSTPSSPARPSGRKYRESSGFKIIDRVNSFESSMDSAGPCAAAVSLVRSRNTYSPIRTSSPLARSRSLTGTRFTKVPLRLSRSRIAQRPSATRIRQCRRETEECSSQIAFDGSLPITNSPELNGNSEPFSGPEIVSSLGFMAAAQRQVYASLGQSYPIYFATYPMRQVSGPAGGLDQRLKSR